LPAGVGPSVPDAFGFHYWSTPCRSWPPALLRFANRAGGSKDLFVETETQQTSELGTCAVNEAGKPVVLQIHLKHR
jgi:hypothetical protein